LKKKIKAFTLLECLIALFIISAGTIVIRDLTSFISQETHQVSNDQEKDWQLFCTLLRNELSGSTFDKVENNFLYVTKGEHWRMGLVRTGDDFRKSHANGQGYQPMLHGVKDTKITEEKGLVTIKVSFEQGGERIFLYKFSDKG